jgi:hypothetical protein
MSQSSRNASTYSLLAEATKRGGRKNDAMQLLLLAWLSWLAGWLAGDCGTMTCSMVFCHSHGPAYGQSHYDNGAIRKKKKKKKKKIREQSLLLLLMKQSKPELAICVHNLKIFIIRIKRLLSTRTSEEEAAGGQGTARKTGRMEARAKP